MKHLIIVCNLEDINYENLCTSSSRYELGFSEGLSAFVERVSIVSPKAQNDLSKGNITLYSCRSGNLMRNIKPVVEYIKGLVMPEDETAVLFWGYNPLVITSLCALKSHRIKIISMIYDTHSGELSGKSFLKKTLINLFYGLGKIEVNRLDGIFLFKGKARERLHIKTKSCVILPAVEPDAIKPFSEPKKDGITFFYSGTLCEYNGISNLLEAFNTLDYPESRLEIYGDGPLQDKVRDAAAKNPRIIYGGRISNGVLLEKMKNADVMLNLRKVPSEVNDYAFPSKLTEYMAAGKVVMSTDVSDSDDFKKAVYLLEDFETETIASALKHVCETKDEFREKINAAAEYLKKHHDSEKISEKAYRFMFEELF